MKMIVTGAAGFIGSHLAERALNDGHDVLGVDCFTDYYPRAIKERNLGILKTQPRFRFLDANLVTTDLAALFKDHDIVFHLAAQAGVRASWGESFRIYSDFNVLATQMVLEAAKTAGIRRVVYASSSSVYGDVDAFPMQETVYPRPVSPYGVSKLAGENLCVLYTRNFGLSTVSLRYFTVYGPRQRPDMAFHIFGKAILRGEPLHVFGNGGQTRDFTYIADAVNATYSAATAPDAHGMVFNIGGGSRVSLNHVLDLYGELSGLPVNIDYGTVQKGDVRHTAADISLARKFLDYSPAFPLKTGLKNEWEWLQSIYEPHR